MRGMLTFACVLLLASAPMAGQDSTLEPRSVSEFPERDRLVRGLQLQGLHAKAAARALKDAPDRAATVDLLFKSGRTREALDVLARIVETRPLEMRDAFAAVGGRSRDIAADRTHDYADRLRAIVAAAKEHLVRLPREEAAEVARQLAGVESGFSIERDTWQRRLASFAVEYAGTRAALLAEVDLLSSGSGPAIVEALDAFVREHPGTTEAAKALYTKGFRLGSNGWSFGEREGHDPTDRFFRVFAVYRELRSGRYSPSEWVEKAPLVVARFNSYKPSYAQGNIERVLGAYEEILPAMVELQDTEGFSVPFVIGVRMGELFKMKGDPLAGVEGVFDRLARAARRADAVRLARAYFYLNPPGSVIDQRDGPALRMKAKSTLESLVQNGAGAERRRALAMLASVYFEDGAYDKARQLYQRYADEYPDSDYAWVAALRVGECEEARDPRRAPETFRRAAARYGSNPVATVLGYAYAARAAEAAGDFRQALADYSAALASWDADYGERYSLYSRLRTAPEDGFILMDDAEVTVQMLGRKVDTLRRTTSAAGGDRVERARGLLARSRLDEAAAETAEFLRAHAKSPLVPEARAINRKARLYAALQRADADRSRPHVEAALAALEALSREEPDFPVTGAKIARATLMFLTSAPGDPDALMREAMASWAALDRLAAPSAPSGDLERDVVAVRNAVFRPRGDGLYATPRVAWDSYRWEAAGTSYFIAPAELRVKLHDGTLSYISAFDRFPDFENVLFLDAERRAILEQIMLRLGGTKKRPWVQVMQTPNQPAGPALDILELWKRSFWVKPGHWGGWELKTYPIVTQIEFVDAARTRAAVSLTVGYSGATAQIEKRDGTWIVKELTNFWVM